MTRQRMPLYLSFLALLFASASVPASAAPEGVIGFAGWQARIETPKTTPAQLVITGKVHVRTPGYKLRLKAVRFLATNPPIPVYELTVTAPTKPVAQVLTWIDVRHVEALRGMTYNTVVITYHGRTIARLKVTHGKA